MSRATDDKNYGDALKQNFDYRNELQQKYDQLKSSVDEFGMENSPFITTNPQISFSPSRISWWIAVFSAILCPSNNRGYAAVTNWPNYATFNKSISLQKLIRCVDLSMPGSELSSEQEEFELKNATLIGLKIGLLTSDDISVVDEPIEEVSSLSDDGTEEISLADPREHPHIYISENAAEQYLTFEGWQEVLQVRHLVDYTGFENSTPLKQQFPDKYVGHKYFRGDVKKCGPLAREAVAQASVGIGGSAGVCFISDDRINVPTNYVFVLKEYWNEISSTDGVATEKDIIKKLENHPVPGYGGEYCFKIFKSLNIIYPAKNKKDGFKMNDLTTNSGPDVISVNERLCQKVLTYDTSNLVESGELDEYAVNQFIDAHANVENDEENDKRRVPVEQLMDAFDVWAVLNDAELVDLRSNRAKNMRKGEMRKLLEENWNIEKASVRIDGNIIRAYRPLELDSEAKALTEVDTIG